MKEKDKERSWVKQRYQLSRSPVTCAEYLSRLFSGLEVLSVHGDELQWENSWWQHTGRSAWSLAVFSPRSLSKGTSSTVSPFPVSSLEDAESAPSWLGLHFWLPVFLYVLKNMDGLMLNNHSIFPKIVRFQLMVSLSLDLSFIHLYDQESRGPAGGRLIAQSPWV